MPRNSRPSQTLIESAPPGSHAAAYYDCRVTYTYKAGCESNLKCAYAQP